MTIYEMQLEEIARGNIERHLSDCDCDENDADAIFDSAYTLAFDALMDHGVDRHKAREIAARVSQCFAQP